MLTLCRATSDEQVQKIYGSNLIEKLKCKNRCAEPYYPTKIRRNSDADSTVLSDSSSIDARSPAAPTNIDFPREPCSQAANAKSANSKFKTELCKNYDIHGYCKWADNCFFAHGKAELKSKIPVNQFYKTKVCKHFHKGGFCPYGSRCQYFHFKTYEMNQELLDSLEKKLLARICGESSRLKDVLSVTERVESRLAVFKQLHEGESGKSLQERFYENEF